MLSLTIASETEAMDLGALLNGTEGVQAIAGLTGAGLPPVSVQWSEGAGDGATYRGKRVLPRDMDVPLWVTGETRATLRQQVKKLARILADECTLTLTDEVFGSWTLKVVRVGGGDFVYGPDTDGERDLRLIVTLRAGQPFWEQYTPETVDITWGTATAGNYVLWNDGGLAVPPVWEIRGPGKNLSITSPNGEVLRWNGTLANNEKLIIDCANGTVVDGNGNNRYSQLAPAPRFAYIPVAESRGWQIDYPNADPGIVRTNLHTNPNAKLDLNGWSMTTPGYSFSRGTPHGFRIQGGGSLYQAVMTHTAGIPVTAGLFYNSGFQLPTRIFLSSLSIRLKWYNGTTLLSTSSRSVNPVAPEEYHDWDDIVYHCGGFAPAGATRVVHEIAFNRPAGTQLDVTATNLCFEQTFASDYHFDGDTPDTWTEVYEWTGTPNASTSTMSLVPDRTASLVKPTWREREWLII